MKIILIAIFSLFSTGLQAQDSLGTLLKQYNKGSIPYISTKQLADTIENVITLDARETKEYQVSHLKSAVHVGYNKFKLKKFEALKITKDTAIVVYCSLGIRSETIALKLKKAGYTNVSNLYGGIFEWKNKDFPIFDADNKPTDNIHAFSKEWAVWIQKGTKIF